MQDHTLAIYRLTALWAFIECGLGGILHAVKIPLTGFLVGAFAIVILTLMARIAIKSEGSVRDQLIPAVIVVVMVKAMVTPHAGFGAYLAVGFQGFVAIFLFSTPLGFRMSAILLGLLSMVESALQKIFVLSVIYGNSIWEAVDSLAVWVSRQFGLLETSLSSLELISAYTAIYALWGIIVGWGSVVLAKEVTALENVEAYQVTLHKAESDASGKKNRRWKMWIFALILLLICIYYLLNDDSSSVLYLLARVFLVLFVVFKIIGPILTTLLQRFLQGKQSQYKDRVAVVLDSLPYMRRIVVISWQETNSLRGATRLWNFVKRTILYSLYYSPAFEGETNIHD